MKRAAIAAAFVVSAARAVSAQPTPDAVPSESPRRLTKLPRLVVPSEPVFPAEARHSAVVTLALTIDVDGRVTRAEVLESGGDLDGAAVAAALHLLFEPAEIEGTPTASKIKFSYRFDYQPARSVEPPSLPAPPAEDSPTEVLVRGARRARDPHEIAVSASEGRKVTGTQGDPIKVIENLPGLARAAFGSGAPIVWGSAPGDSRIFVDGVEVPQIFHGAGIRSIVNGDLVDDLTFTPGAYGAGYGRSLGGVIRVDTRDLPSGVHGYVGADTLDASGMVSAQVGDRLRLAVAGRYGWLDRVLKGVDAPDVGDFFPIPRYHDVQLKAQLRLRSRESLDAGVLESDDELTRTLPDIDPAHARVEHTTNAFQRFYLHYRRDTEHVSVDVVPWVGHDIDRLDDHFGANPAALDQRTWRYGLRASRRTRAGDLGVVTAGIDIAAAHTVVDRAGSLGIPAREGDIVTFGQPPGDDTNVDHWNTDIVDIAPYASWDVDWAPFSLSAGVRVDAYLTEVSRQTPRVGQTPAVGLSQLDAEIEPRLAARLRITPRCTLIAAAGLYTQPPSPADLSAVFGSPTLGPESATHLTFGESLKLGSTSFAEVVGFYKWMSDLAVRDPSPTPKLANALDGDGVGRSYGVQWLIRQQPWHGFFGWIAYTLSRSERRDTPTSGWRLFDFDQPHLLAVVASKTAGPWTLGLRFRYARGLPRTPVTGALYNSKDDTYQPIFGPHNSIRLPDFWQLDLRIDREIALSESGVRLIVYLEVLNVTNHQNGEEYVYSVDFRRRGTITGLPAIAVLGARIEL